MSNHVPLVLAVAFAAAVFGFSVWHSIYVWGECRETNSRLYCLRMVSR